MDTNQGPSAAAGFSVEGFTNLNISLTTVPKAVIRIAQSGEPSTAFVFFPDAGYDEAGDAWFGTTYAGTSNDLRNPEAGNYAWHTLIHELGHSLGLEHGHTGGSQGSVPAAFDALEYTVMTYRTYVNGPTNGYTYEQFGAPQTFMMLDIAALQEMYGADYTTNSGDTVYKWNPSSGTTFVNGSAAISPGDIRIFATIWDGGGTDIYDLSAYNTDVTVNLAPGESSIFSAAQLAYLGGGSTYASGNIYNALMHNNNTASLIENARGGSGDDMLIGNQVSNELRGNAGDDTLDGGSGADLLYGNLGDDTFLGGFGADYMNGGSGQGDIADYSSSTVSLNVGTNNAAANTGGDAAGDTLVGIEIIKGGSNDDSIVGNTVRNTLYGNNGDDILNASSNNDTIWGGVGDDTLFGSRGADVLNGGVDTDTAAYSNSDGRVVVDLDAGTAIGSGHGFGDTLIDIENVFGSRFNDFIYGDNGGNVLNGFNGVDRLFVRDGDDTLIGGGGADLINGGADNDTLSGSGGIDRFFFDVANFGNDVIMDFTNNLERMDMRGSGLTYSDLTITQSGGNTIISVNGATDTITLENVTSLINASDFIFDVI